MKILARENPFASDRVEALLTFEPGWLNQTWEALLEDLSHMDYRASIIGPHGSGKTTLLSGLKLRLQEQAYQVESFFLNEDQRKLTERDWERLDHLEVNRGKEDRTIVFLDGAEQMSPWQWRRFKKTTSKYAGLIITQHKQGKMPLWLETETNIEMFRDFVVRLAPDFVAVNEPIESFYLASNGNIREALWKCYDTVADRNVA